MKAIITLALLTLSCGSVDTDRSASTPEEARLLGKSEQALIFESRLGAKWDSPLSGGWRGPPCDFADYESICLVTHNPKSFSHVSSTTYDGAYYGMLGSLPSNAALYQCPQGYNCASGAKFSINTGLSSGFDATKDVLDFTKVARLSCQSYSYLGEANSNGAEIFACLSYTIYYDEDAIQAWVSEHFDGGPPSLSVQSQNAHEYVWAWLWARMQGLPSTDSSSRSQALDWRLHHLTTHFDPLPLRACDRFATNTTNHVGAGALVHDQYCVD